MDGLKRQNENMQKKIENYLEEIEKQKELNAQHETEIETLLKFNERLLGIIENELSNNRKERVSLQPISERSERESDLNIGPMHSFIKARKFGPKSERGSLTSNSLIQRTTFAGNKLDYFAKDLKSEVNHSSQDEHSEYRADFHGPFAPQAVFNAQPAKQGKNEVKNEMLHQIEELKKFKQESSKFYDNKISQIKNLSSKINQYRPREQLNQINQKLNISANTANLLKKIINKA